MPLKPCNGIWACGGNPVAVGDNLVCRKFYEFPGDALSSERFIYECMIYCGDAAICGESDFCHYLSSRVFTIDAVFFYCIFHKLKFMSL